MKRLFISLILTSISYQAWSSTKTAEAYIQQCLPSTHWEIMREIVKRESRNEPYAIGVNAKGYKSRYPQTKSEAELELQTLMDKGLNLDVGLAQINSQHFKKGREFAKRGFNVNDALDPCTNLKMGAFIFSQNYRRYKSVPKALSAYNTGSPTKGFKNGYVERYLSD